MQSICSCSGWCRISGHQHFMIYSPLLLIQYLIRTNGSRFQQVPVAAQQHACFLIGQSFYWLPWRKLIELKCDPKHLVGHFRLRPFGDSAVVYLCHHTAMLWLLTNTNSQAYLTPRALFLSLYTSHVATTLPKPAGRLCTSSAASPLTVLAAAALLDNLGTGGGP